jgi:hypothetical protein
MRFRSGNRCNGPASTKVWCTCSSKARACNDDGKISALEFSSADYWSVLQSSHHSRISRIFTHDKMTK